MSTDRIEKSISGGYNVYFRGRMYPFFFENSAEAFLEEVQTNDMSVEGFVSFPEGEIPEAHR